MIRHIFKIIWNERKTNAWLLLEYIIIFCILWFCSDYLYTMLRSYFSHQGYDLKYVYDVQMNRKPTSETDIDEYALAMTFLERINRHPDIESVSLSQTSVPYISWMWSSNYIINREDSLNVNLQRRRVSSEFFDVFRIKVEGDIFDWTDYTDREKIIITPLRGNKFGNNYNSTFLPISEVHTVESRDWQNGEVLRTHQVIGTANKIRKHFYQAVMSSLFESLQREDVNLSQNNISVRVKPEADKGFAERFMREMREQFTIEPYFLSSVTSAKHLYAQVNTRWGVRDQMNATFAITSFLIINIFLGILGAFWFRTQSRRNEIGLRLALGSSRQKIQGMMLLETMILLSIASVIATIICLHLSNPEILRMLGIPFVNKARWGIGNEQNFINFGITFGFLALVSMLAVLYPARQAAKIMPAETLHEE